ncbi:MAG TPA: hypothetical protein VJR58_20095 [Vineibacter sp.]|nr:hypothetical protein [Vineibacter sp.]
MPARSALPVIDVRDGGPPLHASRRVAQAEAVRDACLGWLPAGRGLAHLGDPLVRWWLRRSGSPYIDDIAAIAQAVPGRGIWFLHGAYLFGCTTLADEGHEGPRLRRTLDWPFPGLGRLVEVARQAGPAGDYLNVTWPGFAGVLTAMAPGRFAAAINQAPMRRRTGKPWLRWLDYAINPLRALARRGRMPPEHLLRRVFETCATFDAARDLLQTVPVARPVLFTLTGVNPGEQVVIEREETSARVLRGSAVVANAWRDERPGWEPRVCGTGAPVENNRKRRAAFKVWLGRDDGPLCWAQPPITNSFTRLAVEMCAARETMRVAGWEADARGGAVRVTDVLALDSEHAEDSSGQRAVA